jgi:hypothetical protein
MIAQRVEQRHARLDGDGPVAAVDVERNGAGLRKRRRRRRRFGRDGW